MKEKLFIKLVCILGYIVGIVTIPLAIGYAIIDETIDRIKGYRYNSGYLMRLKIVFVAFKIGFKNLNLLFLGKRTLDGFYELHNETKEELNSLTEEWVDDDEYLQGLNKLADKIK